MVGFLQTVLSPLKMEVGTIFPRKPKPSTHSHPTHVQCPFSGEIQENSRGSFGPDEG